MKRYESKKEYNDTNEEETVNLPPRSSMHSSERNKLTRIFYSSLTIVFIALTISLIVWGFQAVAQ